MVGTFLGQYKSNLNQIKNIYEGKLAFSNEIPSGNSF